MGDSWNRLRTYLLRTHLFIFCQINLARNFFYIRKFIICEFFDATFCIGIWQCSSTEFWYVAHKNPNTKIKKGFLIRNEITVL